MRQKKHTLIVLLVLGVGLALGAWWYVRDRRRPVAYQTARVERGPLSRLVIATGTVNPMATVQVGTYVSGPIKELFVDFNSPVEQGQRVAKIDPAPFVTRFHKMTWIRPRACTIRRWPSWRLIRPP